MRKTAGILISLVVVCASCNEKTECTQQPRPLDIRASIHNTVISKQSFTEDDRIGVFIVDYTDGQPGVLGNVDQTTAMNVEYVHHTNGYWYSNDGTDLFINEQADLYTYHPYDAGIGFEDGKRNLTAYPFSVETDQHTATAGHSDFLWAKISNLTSENYTAPIVFHHLMSRCEINININSDADLTEPPVLQVYNTSARCTINLRTGVATAAAETDVITAALNPVAREGFDYTYNAVLIPQSLSAETPFLSIIIRSITYIYQLERDLTILPQQCHRFDMTAGASTGTMTRGGFTLEHLITE